MRGGINIHYGYTYEAAVRLDKGSLLLSSVLLMSTGLTWGGSHDLIACAFRISTDTRRTMCQSPNRFGRVDLVHGLALCCSQRIKHVQPQPSQLGSVSTDSRLGPWASRQTVTSSCQIRHDHVTWFTSQATGFHNHNHQPTHSPLISLDSGFFPCLTLEQHRV